MFKNSKRISKVKRIISLLVLLIGLVMIIFVPSIAYSESSSKNLEMSVKVGYEDTIRVGSSCPFRISLINKGEELSGEAQVIADTGYMTKVIYATPFTLPKGSNKELSMEVPINTANKKIEFQIVKGKKVLKTFKYEFKKLISPETPVIGILSDDKSGLKMLNGIKISENITQNNIQMAQKYAGMIPKVQGDLLPDRPAEVIRLDNTNFPVNQEALNGFDFMVVSDYDTSSLNDSQKKAIENWVNKGNCLIVGTGPNSNKVYKGFSDILKPFEVAGQKSISISKELKEYTEKEVSIDEVVVSTGKIGDGTVLIGSKSNPLGVEYKKGNGKLIILAFDPTLNPISSWKDADSMWRKLLATNNSNDIISSNMQYPMYRGYNEGVVYQVPESQTPVISLLLILIIIYIILVGPVIYIILKVRDKRDLNWVIIPVIAFVFIGIIYLAGFKTRYNTSILNSFSIIDIDSSSNVAHIKTSMSAFNNKKGNMIFEYSKDSGVEVNPNRDNSYNPQYNPEDYKNAQIVGKKVIGDDMLYEHYNAGVWEPILVTANKTEKYEGVVIDSVKIENNSLNAVIKNKTNNTFEESFISIGNNFLFVGDVAPGKEQRINVSLNDKSKVKKSFSEYLNFRYPYQPYSSSGKRPKDWKEQIRKRSGFEELLNSGIVTNTNTKITFYALNYNNVDYGIKLNGKKPKKYNTNIIYYSQDILFEKGIRVNIPENMVSAVFEGGEVNFGGEYGQDMIINKSTEVLFKFELPKGFSTEDFTINWSNNDIDLNNKDMYAGQSQLDEKAYKTFVYNNNKKEWEEVPEKFNPNGNLVPYINNLNEIKVKASINLDTDTEGPGYYMSRPEIQLIGVVK